MNEKEIAKAYVEFERQLAQLINEAKVPFIIKVLAVKNAYSCLSGDLKQLISEED